MLSIGKYTCWFTSGIAFGHSHDVSSMIYYCGWLKIRRKTEFHTDFIKRYNEGTWPKPKLWIVKYKR